MLKKVLIGTITASVLITTSCVLLGLADSNWSDGVNCGGHMAESCSRCSEVRTLKHTQFEFLQKKFCETATHYFYLDQSDPKSHFY